MGILNAIFGDSGEPTLKSDEIFQEELRKHAEAQKPAWQRWEQAGAAAITEQEAAYQAALRKQMGKIQADQESANRMFEGYAAGLGSGSGATALPIPGTHVFPGSDCTVTAMPEDDEPARNGMSMTIHGLSDDRIVEIIEALGDLVRTEEIKIY